VAFSTAARTAIEIRMRVEEVNSMPASRRPQAISHLTSQGAPSNDAQQIAHLVPIGMIFVRCCH
jgi:hypothetical protein